MSNTNLPVVDEPNPVRCETCRFRHSILLLDEDGRWKPGDSNPGYTEREYEQDGDLSGECRRYPPVSSADGESFFPQVSLDYWCGEWLVKRDGLRTVWM